MGIGDAGNRSAADGTVAARRSYFVAAAAAAMGLLQPQGGAFVSSAHEKTKVGSKYSSIVRKEMVKKFLAARLVREKLNGCISRINLF
jgi:hypothetical protein